MSEYIRLPTVTGLAWRSTPKRDTIGPDLESRLLDTAPLHLLDKPLRDLVKALRFASAYSGRAFIRMFLRSSSLLLLVWPEALESSVDALTLRQLASHSTVPLSWEEKQIKADRQVARSRELFSTLSEDYGIEDLINAVTWLPHVSPDEYLSAANNLCCLLESLCKMTSRTGFYT